MIFDDVDVVIPARLHSKRLPGKLLLSATGKPLIQHTYEAVQAIIGKHPWVATEDDEIVKVVTKFGRVIKTGQHSCGTNRVAEAAKSLKSAHIINVQGDEPEISTESLSALIKCARACMYLVTTLACPLFSLADVLNPNYVKVVCDVDSDALYFSRAPIPWQGGTPGSCLAFRHLGVYCYRTKYLSNLVNLIGGSCSVIENLEQVAWLESGVDIRVGVVESAHPGIDTLEEYRRFVERTNASP